MPALYIRLLCLKDKLYVIEDAAHAIDAFYKGRPLGSIGHLAAFSFHETKNITCGEGGMLVINDQQFIDRAETIIDKGTNRKAFLDGKTGKYQWVDLGSSYRLSETASAFLLAQLEKMEKIQKKRKAIWEKYFYAFNNMETDGLVTLPNISEYSSNNAGVFYLVCKSAEIRTTLIKNLSESGICASFHYQPLHLSPYYLSKNTDKNKLPEAEKYGECLMRLPLYAGLSENDIDYIINGTIKNFNKRFDKIRAKNILD